MALKDQIKQAFEKSIGGSLGPKSSPEIENLAEDLTKAIAKYVGDLTFKVEDLKGEGVIKPGDIKIVPPTAGINTTPVPISVNISKLKPKGLRDSSNANASVVKVDKDENEKLSGVSV